MSIFDFDEINTEVLILTDEMTNLSSVRGKRLATEMAHFHAILVRHRAYISALTSVIKTIRKKDGPNSPGLMGPAGVGKSWMVAEIKQLFAGPTPPLRREPAPGAKPLPVLSVVLSSDATLKSTLQDLCNALDVFPNKSMTTAAMEQLFLTALKARGVCLIIVDELQNISRGAHKRDIVQKWLKNVPNVANVANVPMLLVGNHEISSLLFERQVQRRFKRVNLAAIPWKSRRGSEFRAFVKGLLSKALFPNEMLSPILKEETLSRLFIQTGGFPSDVVRFLDSAIMAAYATECSVLDSRHFEFAAQDLQQDLFF